MSIKPREPVEEKKQLTQRDDFLAVVAFAGAGGLHWAAGKYPDLEVVLTPLSLILGAIGVVIVVMMLQAGTKKKRR